MANASSPPGSSTHIRGLGWTGVAASGLVFGTIGMFYGIKLLGAFQFSLMIKVEPLFTAAFSLWLLREPLAPHQYLGMLVVLSSLAAYQLLGTLRVSKLP